MKTYKISEILYLVIAGISLFKTISLWQTDNTRAYYFFGFAIFASTQVAIAEWFKQIVDYIAAPDKSKSVFICPCFKCLVIKLT